MKKAISCFEAKYSTLRFCLFFVIFFLPFLSFEQTRGKVEVVKDPLIDTLIAKWSSLNKTSFNNSGDQTINGYRVQIFFGSSRQAAYAAQEKFREEYPETPTYVSYTEPNFKVQAGDFRTRLEAEKLEKEITQMFTSLFIISGKINPPKTDDQ